MGPEPRRQDGRCVWIHLVTSSFMFWYIFNKSIFLQQMKVKMGITSIALPKRLPLPSCDPGFGQGHIFRDYWCYHVWRMSHTFEKKSQCQFSSHCASPSCTIFNHFLAEKKSEMSRKELAKRCCSNFSKRSITDDCDNQDGHGRNDVT